MLWSVGLLQAQADFNRGMLIFWGGIAGVVIGIVVIILGIVFRKPKD